MIEHDIPGTEQGLSDYIRYVTAELKRMALKSKRLIEARSNVKQSLM